MTSVVSAVLAFGYDLGGSESSDGWRIHQVDTNDFIDVPWFDEDGADADFVSFDEIANAFIAEQLGHRSKLTDIPEDDRFEVALRNAGVQVLPVGYENDRFLLVTHMIVAGTSEAREVNFHDLSVEQVKNDWTYKLSAAMKTMGITSIDTHPRWMLIAEYD